MIYREIQLTKILESTKKEKIRFRDQLLYISRSFNKVDNFETLTTAPEINVSLVPEIVSGSRHFVPVTRNSCWSSVMMYY